MYRFLGLLILSLFLSCTKAENDWFPNYPVYLELDLAYEDKDLKAPMAYKNFIYGQTSGLSAVERTGLGGVMVYNGYNGYYAFDLSCPYEKKASIRVEVDENHIKAVCLECGSEFGIYENAGAVLKGPATQGMKRYNVGMNGNKIYISN